MTFAPMNIQRLYAVPLAALLVAFSFFAAGCLDDSGELGADFDFGDNDKNVVLAMGDSITSGSGNPDTPPWPALFAGMVNKTVINEGIGGTQSASGAARINGNLARYKPGYVIIFYGANDAIHSTPVENTEAALRSMVRAAKANRNIPVLANVIHMTGGRMIYNGNVDVINERIQRIASEEGAPLANVDKAISRSPETYLRDGLHPNELGNELIALTFLDVFRQSAVQMTDIGRR